MTGFAVYCVSSLRPGNVPRVATIMQPHPVTWVVPKGQGPDYRACGAQHVLEVPATGDVRPLPAQRNAALEHAFTQGKVCIQTDDDPKQLGIAVAGKYQPATIDEIFTEWATVKEEIPAAHLFGVNATNNAFFARRKVTHLCIYGWLFAVWPSPERFDETLPLSEDIDFTCQHLDAYGAIARLEWLMPRYEHHNNRGGCQQYRTEVLERFVDEQLLLRWPQYLKMNPRRLALIMKTSR